MKSDRIVLVSWPWFVLILRTRHPLDTGALSSTVRQTGYRETFHHPVDCIELLFRF
jgi:hypothetical protein